MYHVIDYAEHAMQSFRNELEEMSVSHEEVSDLADAIEDPKGTGKTLPDWLKPWAEIVDEGDDLPAPGDRPTR